MLELKLITPDFLFILNVGFAFAVSVFNPNLPPIGYSKYHMPL
jgi:hypothetical protein